VGGCRWWHGSCRVSAALEIYTCVVVGAVAAVMAWGWEGVAQTSGTAQPIPPFLSSHPARRRRLCLRSGAETAQTAASGGQQWRRRRRQCP
jgi:hypothetical protein